MAEIIAAHQSDDLLHRSSSQNFAIGLSLAFFLLQLTAVLHHAMWRDELQVWMIAQHSTSFLELLRNKGYEGHPAAWYLLVYLVTRGTKDPLGMQLLHLVIASATAYVLARYSPFSRSQKVLAIFGYFLFFEYATISRVYALGVLMIFCFCAVFRAGPRKKYLLLTFLMAMLAQTSIYGVILALCFALGMLIEAVTAPVPRQFLGYNPRSIILAGTLFVIGIALSIAEMLPPRDSGFDVGWHLPLDMKSIDHTLGAIWKTFIPIPQLSVHFWNTNLVHDDRVLAVLSTAILFGSLFFFIRKRTILATYSCGIAGLLLFRHIKYAGYLRQDGHLFIFFLASVWLSAKYPDEPISPRIDKIAGWVYGKRNGILTGLLAIHAAVGVAVTTVGFMKPFSEAKAAAQFLRSSHMSKMFIVGQNDYLSSALAGYLNREIYYYAGERMGSFVVWDQARLTRPKQSVFEVGAKKAAEGRQDVLAIFSDRPSTRPLIARELASFEGGIVADENYYIYLVQYNSQLVPQTWKGKSNVREMFCPLQ